MPPPPGGMGMPPPPGGMGMPPGPGFPPPNMVGMMMGGGGPRMGGPVRPQPTKPVIQLTKKLQAFNWRRVLILPQGTPNKKESVWDQVDEYKLNLEEIEEMFENKVLCISNFAEKGSHYQSGCRQGAQRAEKENLLRPYLLPLIVNFTATAT